MSLTPLPGYKIQEVDDKLKLHRSVVRASSEVTFGSHNCSLGRQQRE